MVSTCFNVVCLSYYGCFSGQDLVNVRIDYRCPFKFPISWTPFIPVSPKMLWPEGLYPWQLELSFAERWIILKEMQCNVGQMSPMMFGSDSALIWFVSYSYIIFVYHIHTILQMSLAASSREVFAHRTRWRPLVQEQWQPMRILKLRLGFSGGYFFLWDRKWCN